MDESCKAACGSSLHTTSLPLYLLILLPLLADSGSAASIDLYDAKGYLYDVRDGCYLLDGEDDSYDSMYKLYINGTYYSGVRSTTEDGGREAVCDTVNIGGLMVQRKVFVPSTQHWARYLEILYNPTSSPISATVKIGGDLGSDGSTTIVKTSDGDATLDPGDRWFVTDDSCDGCGDPSLAHVFDGARGRINASGVYAADGDDNPWYSWNVLIPPGETVVIMHFAVQHTDNANAISVAEGIKEEDSSITAGMSVKELKSLANWWIPLSATKEAPSRALRGQSILYNLTYTAYDTLTNLTIQDTLDPALIYNSDTCGGVLSGGSNLTIHLSNITSGTSGYCEVNVTVKSTAPQGIIINNTAIFTFTASGGRQGNTTASAATTLPNPRIEISKRSMPCAAPHGSTVNYTISYHNPTIVTARNVVIKDYLPSGALYLGDTFGGTYSSGVVTFSIGDVPPGGGGNITLTLNLTATSGVLENRATVYYENDDGVSFSNTSTSYTTIGNYSIFVGDGGYSSIQSAVDSSPANSTIFVCPGTYRENVNIMKPLTLLGAGAPFVKVDGGSDTTFKIASAVKISGFNITSSNNDPLYLYLADGFGIYNSTIIAVGNGIYIQSSSRGEIIGNTIESTSRNGIYASSSYDLRIENNTIKSGTYGDSITLSGVRRATISENTISGTTSFNYGLNIVTSSDNRILNNTIRGKYGTSIYLWGSEGNTIAGNSISSNNYGDGVQLSSSSNNVLEYNRVYSNRGFGIFMDGSRNNTLRGNVLTGNRYDLRVSGTQDSHYIHTIDTTNTADGRRIYYLLNASDTVYDSSLSPGEFYCIGCNNITLRDISVSGNYYGIFLWNTNTSRLINISSSSNYYGIYLAGSHGNLLTGSSLVGNSYGVYLSSSTRNTLQDMEVLSSRNDNVRLVRSHANTLEGLNASSGSRGIYIEQSDNNTIRNTFAVGNMNYDIFLFSSSAGNTGVNNTCNSPDGWNDVNATGCTHISGILPDLVLENFTWSPYNYSIDSFVDINVTVLNSGAAPFSGYPLLSIYVDDIEVYSTYIFVNLAPGERGNYTINFVYLPGGGRMKLVLDRENYFGETNKSNNVLEKPIPPLSGYYDLIISNLSISPSTYSAGEGVTITATVMNNGSLTVPSYKYYYVRFYVDGDYIGTASRLLFTQLPPGGNFTVTYAWTAQGGARTLLAVVDNWINSDGTMGAGSIYEENETNNVMEIPLPQVAKPDLSVVNLTLTPASFSAGDSVLINATVKNLGPGNFSGSLSLRFYRDSTTLTTTSTPVTIPAGSSASVTYTWADAAAGRYWVRAVVDPYRRLDETDEGNNELSVEVNVPLPDLAVEDISFQVDHPVVPAGRSFSGISWRYTTSPPPSGWQNLTYDDSNWSVGNSPFVDIGPRRTYLDLNGGSAWFRKVFNATSGGSYMLRVASDDGVDVWVNGVPVISDSASSHWYSYWNYQVDITPYISPGENVIAVYLRDAGWYNYFDAEVVQRYVAPPESAPIEAGDTVVINATILNRGGNLSSYPLVTKFYLYGPFYSATPWVTTTMDLPSGARTHVAYTWSVEQGGTYRVRVEADASGLVDEVSEDNNYLDATTRYAPLPDLVVTGLYWSPTDYSAGESVNLIATVKNAGSGSTGNNFYVRFYMDGGTLSTPLFSGKLLPGGEGNITAVWTAQPGNHTLRVVADVYRSIGESDESNNDAELNLSSVLYPDLVITDVVAARSEWVVYSGSRTPGVSWRYTTSPPPSGWQNLTYDDSNWSVGYSPFGDTGPRRTYLDLNGGSAWFRKVFNATSGGSYMLRVASDDGVDVWVNGVPVISDSASSHGYSYWNYQVDITPYISPGENVIAVYLRDAGGYNYFDAEITNTATGRLEDFNLTYGESVQLIATVKNVGKGNLSATLGVAYYLGGSMVSSGTTSTFLPVNGSVNVSSYWSVIPGNHTVMKAIADPSNLYTEKNESNNEFLLTLNPVPYPDLVVESVSVSPTRFDAGDYVTLTATLRNNGTGGLLSKFFYTRFSVSGSVVCTPGTYLNLLPGARVNVSCTWRATPGEHNLSVTVDPYGYISESNESNNRLSVPLPRVAYPDLVLSNLTWSPPTFSAGDTVSFSVELRNVGEGNLSSGNKYVGFYINGRLIGTSYTTQPIPVNGSVTLTRTWTATPGNHTLTARADPYDYIRELNETNNQLEVQLPPTPYPDIAVSQILLPPLSGVSYGDEVSVGAVIENAGRGNFSNCFYTRFYMDGAFLGDVYRCGMQSGDTFNASVTWRVTPGNHTLRVVADPSGAVAESDYGNNELSRSFSVNVQRPDFVVSGIRIHPTPTVDGEQVTINATITNTGGNLSSGQIDLQFYVDGTPLGKGWVYGGLLSNESDTAAVTWAASAGNHTITVVVDSESRISELNESNNRLSIQMPVTIPYPELTVSSIYLSKPNPAAGEYVTIHANITNLGGETRRCIGAAFYLDGVYLGEVTQKVACGILASQTLIASYPWVASPGTHNITVVVDPRDTVPEANESNNMRSATTSRIEAADLVVTHLSYSPTSGVQPGDTVEITVGVMNNGSADIAMNVPVLVSVGGNTLRADINGLGAGITRNVTVRWVAVSGSNFTLVATADPWNRIVEKDETNNRLSDVLALDVPYPDLVVRNLTWDPASGLRDGDIVIFNLTLENRGPGRALQQRGMVLIGAASLNAVSATPLEPNATMSMLVYWYATPGENLSVKAIADPYNEVQELNESNNVLEAGSIPSVLPVERFTISITPDISDVGLGESVRYTITVNNYGSASSTYSINISGIPDAWYTLDRSTIHLAPGEVGKVELNITLPFNCSIAGTSYPFQVVVTSLITNATEVTGGVVNADSGTVIRELLPGNNSITGSTEITVTWRTLTNSSSVVYIREEGASGWRNHTSSPGYMHSVVVGNLTRNTWYEFYVESGNACGADTSGVRRIYVDNGVSFTQREYTFTIPRDYDQRGQVYIKNTDTVPHTVQVNVVNPYDDLIVGFVGAGSVDRVVTLAPGATLPLDFRMHAQDAMQQSYELVLNLTSHDSSGVQNITDFATVRVNVRFPVVNFSIEEIDSDPITLRKTFRITNHGDTITDLRVSVDDTIKEKVLFEPSIEHGYLQAGRSITFTAIPVLEVGSTGFNGTLFVSGAGKEINTTLEFFTPPGEKVFAANYPVKTINFSRTFDTDSSNLTNPPDGSVVPATVVNGTPMFIGDIVAEVRQNGEPVLGTNVSLTVTGSNGTTVLYGTTDPFGLVYFRIYGPVGNYTYRAEIQGQNISTEVRRFTVSTENASVVEFSIDWLRWATSTPHSQAHVRTSPWTARPSTSWLR